MKLVDTHAHPHMEGYSLPAGKFIGKAKDAGLEGVICVGTGAEDSRRAITFAAEYEMCFASIGLHPHDASLGQKEFKELTALAESKKVVAVGECGLDYHYLNSPKGAQRQALEFQLKLAVKNNLPVIFHVRDGSEKDSSAFEDLFAIIDNYESIRGVVHSFTSSAENLDRCLQRGLYIGLNGIVTFCKDESQLEAFRKVPLDRLLLETDAPFLTPVPYRGTINHSANVGLVAEFLAKLRKEPVADIAAATTNNAQELFSLWKNPMKNNIW